MEILEAILKYFNIDKAKIDCLQAYFDNNKTLVLIVSSILTIILLRFLGKELLLILIPIAISSVIANFFRKKDKEEAQSIRDRDKEDNDARNLRAELREYFLTNCKPIIDEIVDDTIDDQCKKKGDNEYFELTQPEDENSEPLELSKLHDYFEYYSEHIFNLTQIFSSLITVVGNIPHTQYEKRFSNYKYMIDHITKLYKKLLYPKTTKLKTLYFSQKLTQEQKIDQTTKIGNLVDLVDCFFTGLELLLFNRDFDNDKIIFQNYIDTLDKAVLDTGLDNAEDFLFNREALEELLESCENKTTETV